MNEFEKLKLRVEDTPVLDVIQQFSTVGLKKDGVNYVGLCPFHNEKSPSFTISPSKNIYKCFGCGASGDSIQFLIENNNLNFKESVYALAEYNNIPYSKDLTKYRLDVISEKIYHEKPLTNEEIELLRVENEKKYKQKLENFKKYAKNSYPNDILQYFESRYIPITENTPKTAYYCTDSFTTEKGYNIPAAIGMFDSEKVFINKRFTTEIVRKNGKKQKSENIGELVNRIYDPFFDESKESVAIFEGAFNCHAVSIFGKSAIATFGTSNRFESINYLRKYIENRNVIIATDNDKAGCKYAVFLCDLILNSNIKIKGLHILVFPENVDANDMLYPEVVEELGTLENYLKQRENFVKIDNKFIENHKQLLKENKENKEYKPDFKYRELTAEEKEIEKLDNLIAEGEISATKGEIKPDFVLFYLEGSKKIPIASLGNISLISGTEGSGKTFLTSMEVAALLSGNYQNKIIGELPVGRKKICWLDTEQSRYDSQSVRKRAEYMADNGFDNQDFIFINSRKNTTAERLKMLERLIVRLHEICAFYILDGIMDVMDDMNDIKEATKIKDWLLYVTEFYHVHITIISHLNPNGEKKAGHIGSFLGRKAESERKVSHDKERSIKIIECKKARRSPFADFGFDIKYNELDKMVYANIVDDIVYSVSENTIDEIANESSEIPF